MHAKARARRDAAAVFVAVRMPSLPSAPLVECVFRCWVRRGLRGRAGGSKRVSLKPCSVGRKHGAEGRGARAVLSRVVGWVWRTGWTSSPPSTARPVIMCTLYFSFCCCRRLSQSLSLSDLIHWSSIHHHHNHLLRRAAIWHLYPFASQMITNSRDVSLPVTLFFWCRSTSGVAAHLRFLSGTSLCSV